MWNGTGSKTFKPKWGASHAEGDIVYSYGKSISSSYVNSLVLAKLSEYNGKITYESKGTILVYNEVGIKGENANIYWNLGSADGQGEDRKMPVFEMHISKNKFSSYKGRKFLKFIPEMATFMEASDEEELTFQQMMRG